MNKFSTYLSKEDAITLDLLRVELGINEIGEGRKIGRRAKAAQDYALLKLMSLVTRRVMHEARSLRGNDLNAPDVVTISDLCDYLNINEQDLISLLDSEPPTATRKTATETAPHAEKPAQTSEQPEECPQDEVPF